MACKYTCVSPHKHTRTPAGYQEQQANGTGSNQPSRWRAAAETRLLLGKYQKLLIAVICRPLLVLLPLLRVNTTTNHFLDRSSLKARAPPSSPRELWGSSVGDGFFCATQDRASRPRPHEPLIGSLAAEARHGDGRAGLRVDLTQGARAHGEGRRLTAVLGYSSRTLGR